jgi:hypothetical protein
MTFTPNGTLHLIGSVPIDNTYDNVIRFGSSEDQQSYFMGKQKYLLSQYSYVRQDHYIKVALNYEDLFNVNYVMYLNKNKWIYAFVTHKEYLNENATALHIETDVYQTYLFDVTILDSFVVREHIPAVEDLPGSNRVEENLDTGEYKISRYLKFPDMTELWFVVGYTDGQNGTFGGLYGNVYSGLKYTAYSPSDLASLNAFLKAYNDAGKIDAITILFTIPKLFLPATQVSGGAISYGAAGNYVETDFMTIKDKIDGYTPKNKKLFTYPYNFLYASNNKGSSAIYRIEDFTGEGNPTFAIGGNVAPSPTGFCIPKDYRGVEVGEEYQLTIDGFPLCSWINDVYSNWLAYNKAPVIIGSIESAAKAVAGAATGNIGAAVSGVSGVMNSLISTYQHSIQPDQARGNVNAGSLNCARGANTFFLYQMQVRAEFAQRIDSFWDMYGYPVNTVKKPNTSGRPYWNYVLTKNVNLK